MSELTFSDSVLITRTREDLYDMISDVARMGEFSPVCRECWGYRFADVAGGTLVTESWDFLPDGLARFAERFGDDAPAQIEDRRRAAHEGIPLTLAAIKRIAESR